METEIKMRTNRQTHTKPLAMRRFILIALLLILGQIASGGMAHATKDAKDQKKQAPNFTIVFDGNGQDVNPGTMQITQKQQHLNALPPAPARPGYTFTGWNTKKDGKGKAFSGTEKITGNLTLYAQWKVGIQDPVVPQGAIQESWSLMNLLLAILGVLIVLILLFLMIFRPAATESWDRIKNLTGIIVAIIAASANVFIFMQSEPHLGAPADLANGYTILNTAVFIVLLVGSQAALQRTRYTSEETEEEGLEK